MCLLNSLFENSRINWNSKPFFKPGNSPIFVSILGVRLVSSVSTSRNRLFKSVYLVVIAQQAFGR